MGMSEYISCCREGQNIEDALDGAEDFWIDEEADRMVEQHVSLPGYVVRHPDTGNLVTVNVHGNELMARFEHWGDAYTKALEILHNEERNDDR